MKNDLFEKQFFDKLNIDEKFKKIIGFLEKSTKKFLVTKSKIIVIS
jgi:hypothetical protein